MCTTSIGLAAERAVAKELLSRGHKVLMRNWRTRWCEVDIISRHKDTVYFVEVKYRSGSMQGQGLDYIQYQKQKQLKFAVRFWQAQNNWQGDVRILAVAVEGDESKLRVREWVYLDDI